MRPDSMSNLECLIRLSSAWVDVGMEVLQAASHKTEQGTESQRGGAMVKSPCQILFISSQLPEL